MPTDDMGHVSWEAKDLTDQNTPIAIEILSDGKVIQTAELVPTNGIAEFDFISQHNGTFYINAYAKGINSQPDTAEVVVYD